MSLLLESLRTQLTAAHLPPPVSELRFHPKRRWRLDLAWPDYAVAVEVHGGTWVGGRHTTGTGFEKDREKMNEAALHGWIVIEVTAAHVKAGIALHWIEWALALRGWEKNK